VNILILGGNRFVGRHLASELGNNHLVTVFNRSGTGPSNVSIIQGDRNSSKDLDKIDFSTYNVVVDFCLFKPEQFNLIKDRLVCRYIFISSAAAYADSHRFMFNANAPIGGLSAFEPYGREKAECETLIQQSNLDYVIVRPPYVDGANSHRPRLAYFINKLKNREAIEIDKDGLGVMSFVWVEDLVEALYILTIGTYPSRTAVNAVGYEHYTVLELIEELAKLLGVTAIYEYNSNQVIYQNTDLVLTPGSLLEFFKEPFIDRLPEYLKWYNINAKDKYGYE